MKIKKELKIVPAKKKAQDLIRYIYIYIYIELIVVFLNGKGLGQSKINRSSLLT